MMPPVSGSTTRRNSEWGSWLPYAPAPLFAMIECAVVQGLLHDFYLMRCTVSIEEEGVLLVQLDHERHHFPRWVLMRSWNLKSNFDLSVQAVRQVTRIPYFPYFQSPVYKADNKTLKIARITPHPLEKPPSFSGLFTLKLSENHAANMISSSFKLILWLKTDAGYPRGNLFVNSSKLWKSDFFFLVTRGLFWKMCGGHYGVEKK